MEVLYNPFQFLDIVRKDGKVLIKINTSGYIGHMTFEELCFRIEDLRRAGFEDINLAQELQALKEYHRELRRDDWDDVIDMV